MSPSPMPRAAASRGWMRTGSRPLTFDAWLVAPKSSWLCRPRRRLVRDQLERETRRRRRADTFDRRQPGWMSRTVRIAETGDRRRGDLDLAARRRQRRRVGVTAKVAQDAAIPGQGWQHDLARFPELVEIGRIDIARQQRATSRLIDLFEPLPRRTALGKCIGDPQALRQFGEDVVIVARLLEGRHGAMHRHQ